MDIALIVIIAAIAVAVLTIYALRQTKAANSATLQAEALKERTTELAQQLAQCNAQLDSANRQTMKLTSDLSAANSRCSSLTDNINQLRTDLTDTKDNLDRKIKQFNEIAAENGALRERAQAIALETKRLRDEAEERFNSIAQKVRSNKPTRNAWTKYSSPCATTLKASKKTSTTNTSTNRRTATRCKSTSAS